MSKIAKELAAATNVNLAEGEKLTTPAYLKRLIKATADLNDKAWGKLSPEAQEWFNDAADLANKKKDIPAFPDAESEEDDEKPRTRRRASAEDDEPKKSAKAYTPAKGDTVKIVTSRDKVVEGEVVDPDDNGDLVLLVAGEEVGYDLAKLKSIDHVAPEKTEEEEKPRRRRAADDEAEAAPEPEVSDTVEVTAASGRTKVGNIVEIDENTLVIKDASGEEIEYARERVKSIVVKVKNAKPAAAARGKKGDDDEAPAPRGKKTDADKGGDDDKKRATKDDNGGVSVTTRARELMCEDPLDPMSLDDLTKAVAKEKLTCNPNTLKMVHADCVKLFKMLKDAKHLK